MASIYTIRNHEGLTLIPHVQIDTQGNDSDEIYVEIYSTEEFAQVDLGDDDVEEAITLLSRSHGSFVNTLPDCFIGSLSFPNKEDLTGHSIHFGFYLNPKRLIIIDSGTRGKDILESLSDLNRLPKITTPRVFIEFVKQFVRNDAIFFNEIEQQLADAEDKIVEHHSKITNQELLEFRRELLKYDRAYQQLTDVFNLLSKDEYLVLPKEDHRLLRLFGQRTERLFQRAQYLKEYSLQLRELYQTQIDIQQNKTIQWLTVITTLIVPLTFITSWYGMNFKNMPELAWPHSYFVMMGICTVLVIIELIFFKRKKWL